MCYHEGNYCYTSMFVSEFNPFDSVSLAHVLILGGRYGFDGCRRTYLSQRDLQAHINHRHKPRNSVSTSGDTIPSSHGALDASLPSYPSRQSIQVVHSSRSNLIAVPLQGGSRVKPDSQSVYAQSPENAPVTPASGSRYDRKSSYSQHYSRSSSWQFRQF